MLHEEWFIIVKNMEITSTYDKRISNRIILSFHLELWFRRQCRYLGKNSAVQLTGKKKIKMIYLLRLKWYKNALWEKQKVMYQSAKCSFIKN